MRLYPVTLTQETISLKFQPANKHKKALIIHPVLLDSG